jgi:hypothetical protein
MIALPSFRRQIMPGKKEGISSLTIKTLLLLFLLTGLFFWKILLTRQFSLLSEEEGVRQTYSWFNFIIMNLRHGALPLWDPYTGAGSSFPAEMQTGAFSPLNFLLLLFPLNREGLFSVQSYHQWYAIVHFIGACFMFVLVRELKLSRLSALIAGICFSLGGFVIHAPWPHMFGSAIWLPLIFLFLLRALASQNLQKALLYASASGLTLGLSVLTGGLHLVIMQALVIITACIFIIFHSRKQAENAQSVFITIPIGVCAAALIIGICVGAVQLFPSMEYGSRALRWIGGNAPAFPFNQKIPYAYMKDGVAPQAILGMISVVLFSGGGETINPYLGVFPLLAAVIGSMKYWKNIWVRYLTGLAVLSFFYTLGELSFLHGVLYAIVPRLWIAREAGRFIYLASFALPILAAFGIEALQNPAFKKPDWTGLNRVLTGIAIVCAAALMVPALLGHPSTNSWMSFSILLILASYGLFQYIIHGHTGSSARVLIVALTLFDLSAFDWSARNKIEEANNRHVNHLDRLMSCKGIADFLKSKPGPYRVRIDDSPKPNIGDVFQIPVINNTGVTALTDYALLNDQIPDLLNVRYILKPSSAVDPGALYEDSAWKLYENPKAYPAAWVVHETAIEPSLEKLKSRISDKQIDFSKTAVLHSPLDAALEPQPDGMSESATFSVYEANRLEIEVHAQSRGLLVLSEIFYPGWRATVNEKQESIYKANGILRGIVVPRGRSRVVLRYAPVSVIAGGVLSLIAIMGTLLGFALHLRKRNSSK